MKVASTSKSCGGRRTSQTSFSYCSGSSVNISLVFSAVVIHSTHSSSSRLSSSTMALALMTPEQRSVLEDSIHMKDDHLKHKRDQILEWMRKEPYLPELPDDFAEKMATVFLLGTKLSTEKAKNKIDLFYSLRHQLSEVFLKLDPLDKEVKDSLDNIYYAPLTELTPEGNRVHVLVFGPDKEKVFSSKDILGFYKRTIDVQLSRMLQDEFCKGEILIYDLCGIRSSHITELNWGTINKFTSFCQEGLPFRPKLILLINAPGYIETLLNILRPVLKEKVRNRIQVVKGGHTNLYKYVPQSILPSDYGGDAPSLKECNDAWQKTIESMRDFLLEDEKRSTDELKRPKDSVNKHSQTFGVNGTFSKLSLD